MKTTLLLIRHGQTPWNTLGKVQGCTNINLAKEGKEQAILLKNQLKGQFDVIYTSPLRRALETAQIIAEPTALSPIIIEDLKEINFGTWEGMTFPQIKEQYPEAFYNWQTDKLIGPLLDGEGSIKNVSLRAKNCISHLVQQHEGKTIAVVSHGGYIKAALIGLFNWNMDMYHQIALGNTCVTTIRFNTDFKPVLLGLNNTSHLLHSTPSV